MAPGPKGVGQYLRAFDMYRKVPKDLTESSLIGGALSIFAYGLLTILFFWEMRVFFSVNYKTAIEVDHSEDGIFQVNFNITLPGLSCEFAAVDLQNVIGKRRSDLKDRTVHKFSLDGTWQGHATERIHDTEHVYEGTNKDHYGNKRHAIELTAETFRQGIDEYEVMLVDFHAPWCSHCQHLAPIFEHAAEMVKERAPQEIDAHHKHSVMLATVDCTEKKNIPLCREKHIQAYPTMLVFRKSKNRNIQRFGMEIHESYNGKRNAEAIADFTMKVWKEVIADDKELQMGAGTDSTGDGKAESVVRTRGCRIEGFLMAQRVPGKIIIHPYSKGHSLNSSFISTDHEIHHLSFGNRRTSEMRAITGINRIDGAYAEPIGKPVILAEGEDKVGFLSPGGYTHEHYIKVVSTTLKPRRGKPLHAYEYTINSNMFESHTGVPQIVISFDLSPLKVVVTEETKPWIEGIVSMLAILGGVFSASIIFEGILSNAILTVAKKLD
mmetsp:Transcript_22402/g.28644  ORF Transcript_22402/g.28644 Transcript_22402/m.28644 type:complete len:494 (+) Transcript_22402:161-1642(+)